MRLRRSDCSAPGLTRRRCGNGFAFIDEHGAPIADEQTLERVRGLVIPPAWRDVWICPAPNGHIQATGIDEAGRKQYRYHDAWRARRDAAKFDAMVAFARLLPALREEVARELAREKPDRDRVLAAAVRLLDRGFFRVGGEDYAGENGSFGLATICREHVTQRDGTVVFDYPAKSGKRRVQAVVDPDVAAVVRTLKRRRGGGEELLAYKHRGRWRDVRSEEINAWLKDRTGQDVSAKEFRTWGATVLAAVGLAVSGRPNSTKAGRKRAVTRAVKEVADYLGNTPAVARSSYIDPPRDRPLHRRPGHRRGRDRRGSRRPRHPGSDGAGRPEADRGLTPSSLPMLDPMASPRPATTSAPTFEVDRFGWTAAGRLEVAGRWYGVRGRRFVRPTLDVDGPQGRSRVLASLEHKPWAPDEGQPWVAAFPWESADAGPATLELAVAPGVVVALPPPGARPRPVDGPRTDAQPTDPVGLEERGEAAAALLRRLATLRREHAALAAQRDADRSALAAAELERDEALAARDAARGDRATLERERHEALAALDAAAATAPPSASPDDTALKRLESERDALARELDAMKRERAAARRERNELLSSNDATLAARTDAERERDAALEKLQEVLRERDGAAPRHEPARIERKLPSAERRPPRAAQAPEAERRLTRALTVATLAILAVLAVLLLSAVL